MNKKNQNPITESLQDIIKEANLHSEKKLRKNNLSRFTGTSTHITLDTENKKNTLLSDNKETKNRVVKQKKNISDGLAINTQKKIRHTQKKKKISDKKQRKSVWQKKSLAQERTYVSIIDNIINMKKFRGNSILCVGGVRSGKSDFALTWANTFEGNKAFIATMQSPKAFMATQNASEKEKKNSSSVPHPKIATKKEQCTNPPPFFQSNDVKETYRIHTRLDSEIPISSYNPSIDSQLDANNTASDYYDNSDYCDDELFNKQSTDSKIKYKVKDEKTHGCVELDNRISKHQAQRGKHWITIEEPIDIIGAIHKAKENKCSVAIIDCLTLWLTNLMLQEKTDKHIFNKVEELAHLLKNPPIPIAIVSNEVGAGIVPENALARRFRDLQGKANQILAKDADNVVAILCGLPLLIKS